MTLPENLGVRDGKVIWHPYTQAQTAAPPIAIVKGQGTYLFDDQGKRYIDAVSSWWVNLHGHAHPYIAAQVLRQLQELEHVVFAGFTHEPAVKLAEQLLSILPKNQSRIFYSDNGSTAVEVAIKMALQYWANQGEPRTKIIAFENAYHGDTFGAMSISGRGPFTAPFNELLFDVIRIPLPGKKNGSQKSLQKFLVALNRHKNDVAAFIFEPLVLGAGGMLMYEAADLDSLLRICKEAGVLSIADEVMTGFGRTGKYFAVDHLKEKPDIICLSKGLTGGTMALGATACTEDIYNGFLSEDRSKTLFHGHSYTANPVACAAALASFDLLTKEECRQSIARISDRHLSFIKRNKDNAVLKNLRSQGTILAVDVEVNEENESAEPTSYFNPLRDKLYHYFLEKGVILRPLGNTVYVMPPYCITDEDLDQVYRVVEGVEQLFALG
jgi:adenosylmethionine-8-amino-7-oxononanoate aminotransferase